MNEERPAAPTLPSTYRMYSSRAAAMGHEPFMGYGDDQTFVLRCCHCSATISIAGGLFQSRTLLETLCPSASSRTMYRPAP